MYVNAKQTNKDKIYVYSSFKQFRLPVLEFYNEHFGSFPENSLNVGVRFNEQISSVPWHFVKSRFHCIAFKRRMMRKVRSGALYPGGTYNRMYVLIITSGAYT